MSRDDSGYLVVGSDSLIGRALWERLRAAECRVVGTTRRRSQINEDCVYLDLVDAPARWAPPAGTAVAVVCAGVTRLQACENDPVMSAAINVDGISALTDNLVRRGVFVIYLSTNQVFNGSKAFRAASDPLSPQTEYGRQKAAAEQQVINYGSSTAIVRFTKVLEPRPPLFLSWIETLRRGKAIHPFSDMVMAPVPLALAAEGLRCVALSRSSGLFQMSADQDITYAQAAQHLSERLGLDETLVEPMPANQGGAFPGPLPLNTTLDASRFKNEFGIEPPDAWRTLESVLHA